MRILTSISIAALALASCAGEKMSAERTGPGEAGAVENASIRLYALNCGHFDVSDMAVFDRNGAYDGLKGEVVDTCYLIRHSKGDLLWDTGLPDALNAEAEGVVSGTFVMTMPMTLEGQLADLGIAPADIDYLSLSHSHFDHTGNAGVFASATWLVDPAERDFMFRDAARADAQAFASYSALEAAKTETFTEDHDVFGDGAVVIVRTPGHTAGHASLLVRLRNSAPVLLTGDLYHLTEARENRTIPVFNTDVEETLRSMDKFEALAKSEGARVVIQHEADDFANLPVPPSYLD